MKRPVQPKGFAYGRIDLTFTQETTDEVKNKVNKERYGWSKWGGGIHGLIKGDSEWVCQACGLKQPSQMPAFMIPFDQKGFSREYARICGICKHLQELRTLTFRKLITLVRNHGY